ncbi:MAG: hypothetical protein OEY79_02605, partial [Anaplasmataceae bacterium]|nr:hypothetical protein [Anaplasmataceae bacterium]
MSTKQKYNRYYDNKNFDIITNNRVFIKRLDLLKSLIFIVILIILLFYITFICDTPYVLNIIAYTAFFVFIIAEFYYITKRINNIEYQSMLFANALKADVLFIAITSNNNELLYFEIKDNLLLKNKPKNRVNCNFSDVLSNIDIADDEVISSIKYAIKKNIVYKKNIYNSDKDKYYLLLFEPLARPEKTFILKICDATEASIYKKLLDNHSISFYQTDRNKNIIKSNDIFLNLLHKKTCNDINGKIDDILVDSNTLYTDYGAKYNVSTTSIKANDRYNGYLEYTLLSIKELMHEFVDFPIPMIYFDHNGKIIKQNKRFTILIKNPKQYDNNIF